MLYLNIYILDCLTLKKWYESLIINKFNLNGSYFIRKNIARARNVRINLFRRRGLRIGSLVVS